MTITYTYRDGTTTTDVTEWANKYEKHDYRRVALDTTLNGGVVSTIWMGLPGCIYETAVLLDGQLHLQTRTDTEQEALDAHAEAVAAYS